MGSALALGAWFGPREGDLGYKVGSQYRALSQKKGASLAKTEELVPKSLLVRNNHVLPLKKV